MPPVSMHTSSPSSPSRTSMMVAASRAGTGAGASFGGAPASLSAIAQRVTGFGIQVRKTAGQAPLSNLGVHPDRTAAWHGRYAGAAMAVQSDPSGPDPPRASNPPRAIPPGLSLRCSLPWASSFSCLRSSSFS